MNGDAVGSSPAREGQGPGKAVERRNGCARGESASNTPWAGNQPQEPAGCILEETQALAGHEGSFLFSYPIQGMDLGKKAKERVGFPPSLTGGVTRGMKRGMISGSLQGS